MPSRRYIASIVILLGCIFIGLEFWFLGGDYRAASPLVFILGVVGFILIVARRTDPLWKLLVKPALPLQKKLLWQRHIPQLITGLYFNHIREYPDWKTESPDFVPPGVTAAVMVAEDHIKIILYATEYDFVFEIREQDARLELFANDKKVLSLTLQKRPVHHQEIWEPNQIQSFAPGPWINDFLNLREEVVTIIKERARSEREG